MMKKYICFSFLCLIFSFSSCSDDSNPTEKENEEVAKDLINGKWEFVKKEDEHGVTDYSDDSDCPAVPFFNFYNNGTVERGYCGGAEYEGEYSVLKNTLELEHDAPYSGYDRMRANIENITSKEMILTVENGYFDLTDEPVKLYLEKVN